MMKMLLIKSANSTLYFPKLSLNGIEPIGDKIRSDRITLVVVSTLRMRQRVIATLRRLSVIAIVLVQIIHHFPLVFTNPDSSLYSKMESLYLDKMFKVFFKI